MVTRGGGAGQREPTQRSLPRPLVSRLALHLASLVPALEPGTKLVGGHLCHTLGGRGGGQAPRVTLEPRGALAGQRPDQRVLRPLAGGDVSGGRVERDSEQGASVPSTPFLCASRHTGRGHGPDHVLSPKSTRLGAGSRQRDSQRGLEGDGAIETGPALGFPGVSSYPRPLNSAEPGDA